MAMFRMDSTHAHIRHLLEWCHPPEMPSRCKEDFPAGSMWFNREASALFFIKDIRKGQSHPGVVEIRRVGGRDQVFASSYRDMDLRKIVRVNDIPESLQSPALQRIVWSLFHDLHEVCTMGLDSHSDMSPPPNHT